jgi:hypothetical protein
MATEAQIEANRANAQKSTGPRTPEGKEKAAQNSLKHGLLAKEAVVVGEEPEEFGLFRDEIGRELAPVGIVESRLVARIAGLLWRLQRAERVQNDSFDLLYAQCAADPHSKRRWPDPGPDVTDPFLSLTVVKDFSGTRILERLLGYERRIEHSLCRMMAELRKVQGQRQAGAGAAATSARAAVRDTHPADLSRPEAYRPGRRSGRGREVPPLDFALDNLLAKFIAVQGQRAGGRANTPAQQSWQTKPIVEETASEAVGADPCACPSGGRPQGAAPTHITLQTSGPAPAAQGQSCETKPIADEASSLKPEGPASSSGSLPTSDFKLQTSSPAPTAPSETRQTNPICNGGSSRQGGYTPIFRRRG